MAKDFDSMEDSNACANPSIHEVSSPDRRTVLRGAAAASMAAWLGPLAGCATGAAAAGSAGTRQTGMGAEPKIGFKGIPPGQGDTLVVPEGYVASVIAAWG